ncbi:MAG: T9SS type A sorting domain-containing protein [Ignavibacteriales bacterium]|nr:MAG: T9SS type A sorting domain-containing protein [Ignavibacteriales bacterium]
MFAGTRGYWVYRSTNGGENWGLINTGMGEDRYVLSLLASNDGYLFAGLDYYGMYRSVNRVTDIEIEESVSPGKFYLDQNYPNPFNPSTTIRYTIPLDVRSEMREVSLKVYDVLGNEIATLINEEKPAGEYEVEFNPASSIRYPASGIYFYQLKAGDYIQTKKMILMK